MFCGAKVRIIFHCASVVTIFFIRKSLIFVLFYNDAKKTSINNSPKARTFGES